jgi:hypothetical protein
MQVNSRVLIMSTLVITLSAAAQAAVVTQWNFNSNPADANVATGSLTPNIGSGTALLLNGVAGSFASGTSNGGSSDPAAADNTGWGTTTYAAQGTASGQSGVQFNVSTVGFQGVTITWDQRNSNTSSKYGQLLYSIDGVNFTSTGLANDGIFSADLGGDTWYNNRSVDLSGVLGATNNANFAFRIVAVFDPSLGNAYSAATATSTYAASGTWRFDMVTINGTAVPAPGAVVLLSLAGLASCPRRRRA